MDQLAYDWLDYIFAITIVLLFKDWPIPPLAKLLYIVPLIIVLLHVKLE